MAEPTHIEQMSGNLALLFSDGTRRIAMPTPGGLWLLSAVPEPPVVVPPPPPPTPGFRWPYNPSHRTTYSGHSGIDWPYARGTDIPSIGAGKIISRQAGFNNSGSSGNSEPNWRGNSVTVDHGVINGQRVWSLYAHMEPGSPFVSLDQQVTRGQTLGKIGNSGYSKGNHLHFEVILNGRRVWDAGRTTIDWMNAHAAWPA